MSDLIRRSDALDALGEEPLVWYDGEDEIAERNQWRRDKAALESLPSATCDDCIWHVCNYNKIDWEGEDGYISRRDAVKPFCVTPDGTRIPEVDCDNFPVEFSVEFIKKHLLSLPSADPKTGEWGPHGECPFCSYIRQWDDDNFCANCGARMKREESEEDYDYERATDQMEHDIVYEPTYNSEDGCM